MPVTHDSDTAHVKKRKKSTVAWKGPIREESKQEVLLPSVVKTCATLYYAITFDQLVLRRA